MEIAVVVLNWNGKKLLERFLPSLVVFSKEATVYVIDNASTDDSVDFIQSNFSTVTTIQNDANYGFAEGYNRGLKGINATFFALVNTDVEVTENWLQPLIKIFNTEPNTAIIQPKILDYNRKNYFEYAGAAGGFIDSYGFPFCRGRIFDTIEKDNGQYNDDCEIFWASGACLVIRSTVFNELKGFDIDFFAHQEEIDLCWRAFNLGHTIKYTSKSVVYHIGGATLEKSNPRKTELNFRNSLFMLAKNLPKEKLYFFLFKRMLFDGVAGIYFLFQGKFTHFIAVIKAHISFYCQWVSMMKKRTGVQNTNYYKIKSVVFAYYINNGTIFEKIIKK